MTRNVPLRWSLRDRLAQAGLIAALLGLGALALAGPSGLLAWAERKAVLDKREARIAALEEERAELRNRVDLLDRDSADPDMVTELLRRDLNVAHPDDYVIELRPPQPER